MTSCWSLEAGSTDISESAGSSQRQQAGGFIPLFSGRKGAERPRKEEDPPLRLTRCYRSDGRPNEDGLNTYGGAGARANRLLGQKAEMPPPPCSRAEPLQGGLGRRGGGRGPTREKDEGRRARPRGSGYAQPRPGAAGGTLGGVRTRGLFGPRGEHSKQKAAETLWVETRSGDQWLAFIRLPQQAGRRGKGSRE